MGNQQGDSNMVTELDWAWLAGMMNGDGCFSLTLRKIEKRWKCDMTITLTQTDPCLIERASDILIRGIGCNPAIQEYAPAGNSVNPKFNMRVGKMEHMAKMMNHLTPYLCGAKLAKVKLMLRYIENRIQYDGHSRRINTIENDPISLEIASEFYSLSGKTVPKEVVKALRDYPHVGVGASAPKCATL